MMPIVFIEPNDAQKALIAARGGAGATIVTVAASEELRSGRMAWMRWHCCGEAAIYLVASVPANARGELAFDNRCLDMLTKMQTARVMAALGIPTVPKHLLAIDERPRLPAVLKPNFGFASILVKRVTNDDDLSRYRRAFVGTVEQSLIADFRRRLFDGRKEMRDAIVVEDDLSDATFLSIAFRVASGALVSSYPVEGAAREQSAVSDFFWTSFAAPARLSRRAQANVDGLLTKIAAAFGARHSAIYHAELMVDSRDAVYVVEFSPRVSGGSIPALIRAAYGVDVDDLAIALARGDSAPISERRERRCILIRRDADASPRAAGTLLSAAEKTIGPRRLVDEIYAEEG